MSVEVPEGKQGPGVSQADEMYLTEIVREGLGNVARNLRERNKDRCICDVSGFVG